MIADTLIRELLAQTHDKVAEQACEFFKKHNRLEDLKASQINALKAVWENSPDWPSLLKNLRAFLKHQKQRDDRVGVTGWDNIAAALQETLQNLPQVLRKDVFDLVDSLAEEVKDIAGDVAIDVRYFFDEPQEGLRQRRVDLARYWLVRNFLACLYRLYRGPEVLPADVTPGQLYSQGDCS